MANFNYTTNASFTPFTFEELLKPLAMYTQEYNTLEESMNDLGAKADLIKAYANEIPNSKVANIYKQYIDKFEQSGQDLLSKGLTPTSKKELLNLRRLYSSDIVPIITAIDRRKQLADEQRKALLQNPTLMFQRDFNKLSYDTSLDRFLENPNYDYGDQYSGALLTQEVSKMAANLARELRGTSIGKLDEYTNTFLKKYGLSSGEVLTAIYNPNDSRGSRALRAIYDAAVQKVPESLRNLYAKDIEDYATQGFWNAIGQDQISTYANKEAIAGAKEGQNLKDYIIPTDTRSIPVGKGVNTISPLMKTIGTFINISKQGNTPKKVGVPIRGEEAATTRLTKGLAYGDKVISGMGVQQVDLFNNNNTLKTKEEFMSQAGNNPILKKSLNDYWNNTINPILNQYNVDNPNSVTFDDFDALYKLEEDKMKQYGTSTFMDVLDFPVGSTAKELDQNLSRLANQEVWLLGPSNDGSTVNRKKSNKTLGSILKDAENKDKSFSTYISEQEGQESIIIQMDNDLYQIPINTQISSGIELIKLIKEHKKQMINNNEDAAKEKAQQIISQSGFYSGYKYAPTESKVFSSTGIK